MKNTKVTMKYFTVPEYEKEQDYLRKKHQDGWGFIKVVFPGIYIFEKCEPEDVVYQLDYNQEGISHRSQYVKMFEDCEWEHILDFFGYSYFRKPVSLMKDEEEIFSDAESKLDMTKRVFRGRMIPLLIIFFGTICPQLFIQHRLAAENATVRGVFYLYIVALVVYIAIFTWFGMHYWKLYKKVNNK